jgi:hypothetical protein
LVVLGYVSTTEPEVLAARGESLTYTERCPRTYDAGATMGYHLPLGTGRTECPTRTASEASLDKPGIGVMRRAR